MAGLRAGHTLWFVILPTQLANILKGPEWAPPFPQGKVAVARQPDLLLSSVGGISMAGPGGILHCPAYLGQDRHPGTRPVLTQGTRPSREPPNRPVGQRRSWGRLQRRQGFVSG